MPSRSYRYLEYRRLQISPKRFSLPARSSRIELSALLLLQHLLGTLIPIGTAPSRIPNKLALRLTARSAADSPLAPATYSSPHITCCVRRWATCVRFKGLQADRIRVPRLQRRPRA